MRDFLKVGISGVRGVVGQSFTPQLAAAFAKAFGLYVGRGNVLVGRDTRPSGSMYELAVVAGLQSVGCRPVLTGIVATPSLLHLARDPRARGGIMITASHNPSPWNALKFVDGRGMFLRPACAEELYDIYHQDDFTMVPEADIATTHTIRTPCRHHFDRVCDYVDTDAAVARRFKVAVDCCNGVGAVHTRAFLERLGCEVFTCMDAPTGIFEREPEPLPENLGVLRKLVTAQGCDVGFAQDTDGDRLALVDETGRALGEDFTVALATRRVLEAHSRGPVAATLSTSRVVQDVANACGVEYIRTRIGEIHVSEAMLAAGAVAGGEGNGGMIVPAIHPCRDSYAGMALVLELLAAAGKPLSALWSEVPRYHVIKEKVHIRPGRAPHILRAARYAYAEHELSLIDGVHVDFGDRWVHIRSSNTEPVMRITAEAAARAEAAELVANAQALIAANS